LGYKINLHKKAIKDLNNLDFPVRKHIVEKIETHLVKDPINLGKPLKGNFKGLYRYRIGDYRVIYMIDIAGKIIFITNVNHRKTVYQ
jgi:mRNA interferase RelE/StbE